VMVVSQSATFAKIAPFYSWNTPIAWTGFILFADSIVWRARHRAWMRSNPREFIFLALASIPLWLVFEFYNLYIENWYYTGLPENFWLRQFGYAWSFATIWPAIFEAADLIDVWRGAVHSKVDATTAVSRVSLFLSIAAGAYIADSKAQAVKEAGPYFLYFNRTLFSHGNVTETNLQRGMGYVSDHALDYVSPENLKEAARSREDYRNMTMEDVARRAETMPWGTAEEVRDRIIEAVNRTGAEVVHVRMNTGAMPHEMFVNQIRLFADKVLPKLQAHKMTRVPMAEEVTA